MAFDGITVRALTEELKKRILGGRLYKIAEPEPDEILLTVKMPGGDMERVLLSANASLPFIYLTKENKKSPAAAPNFCMLLRKHIQNGRVTDVSQPGLERIIRISVEHLNEMGDLTEKILVIELMGKHSNIIFLNQDGLIIDSIKHISEAVSSVRTVLPGRSYFIPKTVDKLDPTVDVDLETFITTLKKTAQSSIKAIYGSFTGFSPVQASELCYSSGFDGNESIMARTDEEMKRLYDSFQALIKRVKAALFQPEIVYENGIPKEFSAVHLSIYEKLERRGFESISEVLKTYYGEKNSAIRIRQRSADLRKIVGTLLERAVKKYDLQQSQMKDTEKRDKYRIYGELLNTYGYQAEEGSKSITCENYYTGESITIPLDTALSPLDNAKRYFERYQKLKRTAEALHSQLEATKADILHLESVQASLDIAENEGDLELIRRELFESGFIKKRSEKKGQKLEKSNPIHYISSDGFDLYVGKNNYQNDELTFHFASANDWWFHSKKFAGSHVIMRVGDRAESDIPDRAFNEAGALAAYYSKGRGQSKVEIDYVKKREVKKPAGARPGFVVYYTNYSMSIDSDIGNLKIVD